MTVCKQGRSLIILFLIITGCSQKQSLEWIPFNWEGDTISSKYIEKAYLYIPVKIDDLPDNFTMQLDLGAMETMFFGKSIKPYLEKYTSLANKLDSFKIYPNMIFRNVNLHMGTVDIKFDIWHHHYLGEEIPRDSLHSKTPKDIGIIAPDMFQDKILMIDYKSCRLAVSDRLPAEYKNLPAVEFTLQKGVLSHW